MPRLLARLALANLCLIVCTARAQAAVPADTLLPQTTKGVLLIEDVNRLKEHWDACQLGQLSNDPVMQPFVEDFKEQLKRNGNRRMKKLGLTLEDLDGVPGGEVAIAVLQPKAATAATAKTATTPAKPATPGTAATVILIDTTGKAKEAKALTAKMVKNLVAQGAAAAKSPNPAITLYSHKPDADKKVSQAAFFYAKDLVAVADDYAVLEAIFKSQTVPRKDSLAAFVPYTKSLARVKSASAALAPDLRWFIEPFGYAECSRVLNPAKTKKGGPDKLDVLRTAGFSAIQGLGGQINFNAAKYDLLHRTAIYAPAAKIQDAKSKQKGWKYSGSGNMLAFPNGGELKPQPWAPRDLAVHISFNWDMKQAFESADALVDGMAGQKGAFRDAIKALLEEVNGPQVDIRKNIIGQLGTRATVLSDYQLPIDMDSERTMFAAECKDADAEKIVAAAIEKLFKGDADIETHLFEDHKIFEILPPKKVAALPEVKIEMVGYSPVAHADRKADDEPRERALKKAAITVAHGHLFVSSHVDFLKVVLSKEKGRERLEQATDYRIVNEELDALGAKEISFRIFTRTDESYRPTYELIRMGKMPESQSLLGKVLNNFYDEGKEDVLRPQKIDGKNLPDFEVARRYLGPGGAYIVTEDDGWLIVGFTLVKDLKR